MIDQRALRKRGTFDGLSHLGVGFKPPFKKHADRNTRVPKADGSQSLELQYNALHAAGVGQDNIDEDRFRQA